MAETNEPLYVNLPGTHRLADLGRPWADAMLEGVVNTNDLEVTQRAAGPNLSVDVGPGVCWVQGDTGTDPPKYRCHAPATLNLAVQSPDAEPRIDLVVAQVYDSEFLGSADAWERRIIKGTPGATPAPPALPAGAIELARVSVEVDTPDITTSDITNRRQPSVITPRADISRAANLAVGTSTTTAVSLDTENYDTWFMWPAGTYTPAVLSPRKGLYRVTAQLVWAADTTTTRRVLMIKRSVDGETSVEIKRTESQSPSVAVKMYNDLTVDTVMGRGGYVELAAFQDSGVNLNVTANVTVTLIGN